MSTYTLPSPHMFLLHSRVSPPSLHANEEMLDEDSEEEMDVGTNPLVLLPPPPRSGLDPALPQAPPPLPLSACRDSVSPYVDDDFAMFVAQEAHKVVVPVLDQDAISLSPSPTPTPSSNDLLLPVLYEGLDRARGDSFHTQHFGVTASCPSIPLQLSTEAPNAVSDPLPT